MAKATYAGNLSGGFSLDNLNNQFNSIFQGDSSPLRPRAQSTPDMTVAVSASLVESYFSPIWLLGTAPLNYAGGNSDAIVAPISNPRIDLLYITSAGTLTWITGSESASPTAPSLNADGFPICYVYCKITMTKIVDYEDKDANSDEGYIWKDVRSLAMFSRVMLLLTQGGLITRDVSKTIELVPGNAGTALTAAGAGANLAWLGMTTQGDVEFHNGTTRTRLPAGVSGQFFKTQGAGANPVWASPEALIYFERDASCIVAFAVGAVGATAITDFSLLENAITLTSLAEANLVAGKISPLCYSLDGAADYALIATHAEQAGMSALTIEAWIYRTTTVSDIHSVVGTKDDNYIDLDVRNATVDGQIATSSGTEAWSVNHGLSGDGKDQWVYLVVAWNNAGAADIYINGALVGNGDNVGNGTVSDSANGIYIGVNATANGQWFGGKLDGVRLLRRKMGAAEVLVRYNAFV